MSGRVPYASRVFAHLHATGQCEYETCMYCRDDSQDGDA